MASCFSCFTATFHYHFDNFTFARSRESVHTHHNNHSKLHSLRRASFVSLPSFIHKQHRKRAKASANRPTAGRSGRSPPRKKSIDVTSFYSSSPSPRQDRDASTTDHAFNPVKSNLEHGTCRIKPLKDPRRHVSFVRSTSQRTSSELDFSFEYGLLKSIFSHQDEPISSYQGPGKACW